MVTSDFRPEVKNIAVSCMRHASGHNYRNSSFIVDVAIGQIPRSTERISSSVMLSSFVTLKSVDEYSLHTQ